MLSDVALKNDISLCYISYSKTHAGKDSQMVSKVRIIFWSNELMRSGGGKTLRRNNGYCHYEGTAGSRCPFRTPGEALEPEDEEVYFRGKKRDPYCGSSEDAQRTYRSVQLCQNRRCYRGTGAFCRHQETGPGFNFGRGQEGRLVLR